MSSSAESPSRFIWEPRYRNPVTNPRPEALPSLHTPHVAHPFACHHNQPAFGARWQPGAHHELKRLLSWSLQPRVVELDDFADSFTDSPTASRFSSPPWDANCEAPSGSQSPRSGISPRTRARSSVAAIPQEHRYTAIPSRDVSPRQSLGLPPLRPQRQISTDSTGVPAGGGDYREDTRESWTQEVVSAKAIQDICLAATRRYLRAHLLNWRSRNRRQRSVSPSDQQPPWVMRRRRDRARRFHPYATGGWSTMPSLSSSMISDGDDSTGSVSSFPQRRGSGPGPARSHRRTSRPASLPPLPVSPTSSQPLRGRLTHVPGCHGQYYYEPLPYHDDEMGDGDDEEDEEDTLPPADSLLANASDICTLIWQRARRQRLHVIGAEGEALDDMAALLGWAEMVAFAATTGPENLGADRGVIVEAAGSLCHLLDDAIGLDALVLEVGA